MTGLVECVELNQKSYQDPSSTIKYINAYPFHSKSLHFSVRVTVGRRVTVSSELGNVRPTSRVPDFEIRCSKVPYSMYSCLPVTPTGVIQVISARVVKRERRFMYMNSNVQVYLTSVYVVLR